MQGHGLSVEDHEHWYLCQPGVITMTLRSSLHLFGVMSSKSLCVNPLNNTFDDSAFETGLTNEHDTLHRTHNKPCTM
jgi:hypothetical protein